MMRGAALLKSGIVANSANLTAITPSVAGIGVGKGSVLSCARATLNTSSRTAITLRAFRFIGLLTFEVGVYLSRFTARRPVSLGLIGKVGRRAWESRSFAESQPEVRR